MVKSNSIRSHFRDNDPLLFSVLDPIEIIVPQHHSTYFVSLCRSIIGQQLSTTVADVIFSRFEALLTGKTIEPGVILTIPDEAFRKIGMSGAKVKFIKDAAEKVKSGEVSLPMLASMDTTEVIEVLTKIKGVGPWTAEMFCMFTLGREDVFSFGDLGLKRAIQELYSLKTEPSVRTMTRLSNKWKPYRTYAALALWNFKDR